MLVQHLPADTLWFGDAGQPRHAMAIELARHGLICLDSPTGGPMGWAIAAAIGAASGEPDHPVCCFTGDGSTLLLGNEMATAARAALPITFVLAANGVLGNPHGRLRHTPASGLCELPVVDWCLWGRSLGLAAVAVPHPRQLPEALAGLPANRPRLLVVPVPGRDAQVMPPYSLNPAAGG
jgi:thiamine pyrophosphate-dependent acetolactate synthase large subunit-like protein